MPEEEKTIEAKKAGPPRVSRYSSAAAMAEKVELDVVGVVENMSWYEAGGARIKDLRAAHGRVRRCLLDQPGLAHPGLADDEHERPLAAQEARRRRRPGYGSQRHISQFDAVWQLQRQQRRRCLFSWNRRFGISQYHHRQQQRHRRRRHFLRHRPTAGAGGGIGQPPPRARRDRVHAPRRPWDRRAGKSP